MNSFVEFLIKNIEPNSMSQGVTIPAKNFIPRYGDTFNSLFKDESKVRLTRADVFQTFSTSDIEGFKAALAWGFPRGSKPGGASLQPAIEAFPFFEKMIRDLRLSGLTEDLYEEMNSKPSVKNGVTTKLLYFSGIRTESGAQTLIFDSRVRQHLFARDWDEYRPLTKSLLKNKSSLAPKAADYLRFVEITDEIATQSGWAADSIEMHMFIDAPGRREAVHKE